MTLAREGTREIVIATLVCGGLAVLAGILFWPLAIPIALVWLWALSFFRDPRRACRAAPNELCCPADGTITEVTRLAEHPLIGGPAVRIGMFLSIFNVHVNRSPCAGLVGAILYREGKFLDARHPDSGPQNESNTLVIHPQPPIPGPLVVRQVAGKIARRIICHARCGDVLTAGQRFGLIKFGSRTELLVPDRRDVIVLAAVGQKVRAGLSILVRIAQPAP